MSEHTKNRGNVIHQWIIAQSNRLEAYTSITHEATYWISALLRSADAVGATNNRKSVITLLEP